MKNIDITKEVREQVMKYMTIKAQKAEAEKAEKAMKKELAEFFKGLGKAFNADNKTDYLTATVQVQGKAKHLVYKETTAQGAVDWKAYAMALGGTEEWAEQFRKADTVRTSLDWATTKQEQAIKEMGL